MHAVAQSDAPPDCPAWDTLVEFNAGLLTDPEMERVAVHLATCGSCETAVRDLLDRSSGDGLSADIRRCMEQPAAVAPAGPAYAAMEAAARALGRTAADPGRATASECDPDTGFEVGDEQTIGPYAVLGVLGHGGMGVVYRAVQKPVNRVVALKTIIAGPAARPDAVARFRREGEAIARLDHPNIVRMYDFDEWEGCPYFSMEFVDGGSLANRLTGGPLDFRAAAELVRTLALAADYAHGRRVVHRDLKPGNVLLTADGTPKISDFGLSKLLDDGLDRITQTEAVLGTPSYMAPEQAGAGHPDQIDARTDVYALGAILYEAMVGCPPFGEANKLWTLEKVRTEIPLPPSKRRAGVPPGLEAVCLKCLEKDPALRYPSAGALAEDLGRWCRDERPTGPPGRVRRVGRAVRRQWAVAAAVVALLTGVSAVAAIKATRDPDRALRQIEAELAAGKTVELIGEKGGPKWSRWVVGESGDPHTAQKARAFVADNNNFVVQTWRPSLLELLPKVPTERYRITAEVRHIQEQEPGCVGIYIGRQNSSRVPQAIHFFSQYTFTDFPTRIAPHAVIDRVTKNNGRLGERCARLSSRLLSDDGGVLEVDTDIPGVGIDGPYYIPVRGATDVWRTLDVAVGPDSITATWNGVPMSIHRDNLDKEILATMEVIIGRRGIDSLPCDPAFVSDGGAGLYASRGVAFFRNVRIVPTGR